MADELKERLRQLEDELSRREGGLERAMEQLGRAAELRREGADSAERLEEVVRVLTASLATAEERSRELERSSTPTWASAASRSTWYRTSCGSSRSTCPAGRWRSGR